MAEQKNKNKFLSDDEVRDLVNDQWGTLKLSDAPINSQFIAKIDDEVQEKKISDTTIIYSIPVTFEPRGYEAVQFRIQVGESAVKRMKEKYSEYIGLPAFFAKTKYGNVYPQFITPFKPKQAKQTGVVWKKREDTEDNSSSSFDIPVKDIDNGTQFDIKTSKLPEELEVWFKQALEKGLTKQVFYREFTDNQVLNQGQSPTVFIDWMSSKESCGTDYIAGVENHEERNAKAVALFWSIIARYDGM